MFPAISVTALRRQPAKESNYPDDVLPHKRQRRIVIGGGALRIL